MKFIPILFSTPMVKALLEKRKTMTRRMVPPDMMEEYYHYDDMVRSVGKPEGASCSRSYEEEFLMERSRWKPGDILWVRESFSNLNVDFTCSPYWIFKADMDHPDQHGPVTWKPSIHMPKKLCRIFLEVTEVRVERLQDITEEDCLAEGSIERNHRCNGGGYYEGGGEIWDCICQNWLDSPERLGFFDLWEDIHGPESLTLNPWVWVISFKQISKPENFN